MSETCINHHEIKAVSHCHHCLQPFCGDCLTEGKSYYYCASTICQNAMRESGDELILETIHDQSAPKLVTIAKYLYPWEADLAKARLEAEGIPAFAADEYIVRFDWFYSNAVGGVRLQVAEPDAELAKEILATEVPEDLSEED